MCRAGPQSLHLATLPPRHGTTAYSIITRNVDVRQTGGTTELEGYMLQLHDLIIAKRASLITLGFKCHEVFEFLVSRFLYNYYTVNSII